MSPLRVPRRGLMAGFALLNPPAGHPSPPPPPPPCRAPPSKGHGADGARDRVRPVGGNQVFAVAYLSDLSAGKQPREVPLPRQPPVRPGPGPAGEDADRDARELPLAPQLQH